MENLNNFSLNIRPELIIANFLIHSLIYLRSATFGSIDIVIRKSEFVAKTQFLSKKY